MELLTGYKFFLSSFAIFHVQASYLCDSSHQALMQGTDHTAHISCACCKRKPTRNSFLKYFWLPSNRYSPDWGTNGATKSDGFSEKFQTALDFTHFLKIILHFSENPCLKTCIKVQNLQYKFLDWKWQPPPWNFSENSSDLVPPSVPDLNLSVLSYMNDTWFWP